MKEKEERGLGSESIALSTGSFEEKVREGLSHPGHALCHQSPLTPVSEEGLEDLYGKGGQQLYRLHRRHHEDRVLCRD